MIKVFKDMETCKNVFKIRLIPEDQLPEMFSDVDNPTPEELRACMDGECIEFNNSVTKLGMYRLWLERQKGYATSGKDKAIFESTQLWLYNIPKNFTVDSDTADSVGRFTSLSGTPEVKALDIAGDTWLESTVIASLPQSATQERVVRSISVMTAGYSTASYLPSAFHNLPQDITIPINTVAVVQYVRYFRVKNWQDSLPSDRIVQSGKLKIYDLDEGEEGNFQEVDYELIELPCAYPSTEIGNTLPYIANSLVFPAMVHNRTAFNIAGVAFTTTHEILEDTPTLVKGKYTATKTATSSTGIQTIPFVVFGSGDTSLTTPERFADNVRASNSSYLYINFPTPLELPRNREYTFELEVTFSFTLS